MHLRHGVWSAAQTLGLTNNARARRNANVLGVLLAVVIAGGFSLVPIFVLLGVDLMTTPHGTADDKPDMPDTTLAFDASPTREPGGEGYDDAAGYYVDGDPIADTKSPGGPLEERWGTRKFEARIANPANRRRLSIIVVGTGLAGASAAATLGEAGYVVKSFCYQDSPRRAHSIAAQGGINAAKNYKGDGDSVYRLFYDTIKGGDYRSRESNVYRLAEVSVNIIDQCVAQGVPFAREYGGLLDNRSFGGVQVSRTFYARGQTGQQLLIGAYQALERQVAAGTVRCYTRHEMLELIVVDGRARGIIVRDLVTGEIETYFADVVVLASGGYGNVFFLSTNAMGSNVTATWRAHRKGALMANPCYTQIHPTCIPVTGHHQSKLTLMSESLRNDGRIWVPKKQGGLRPRTRARSPRRTATTTSSASTRRSATWSPATSPPARPRTCATRAAASAPRSRAYAAASTWTSPRPSTGSAARRSRRSTATSSTCTPGSRARTPTRSRCGSTRRSTT